MGLSTSHGAFKGAYSAFNRLRQEVALAAGGRFPPHYLLDADGEAVRSKGDQLAVRDETLDQLAVYLPDDCGEGLYEFLTHSDCEGQIEPGMCIKVANDLEALLPKVRDVPADGHLGFYGGYRKCIEKFIAGCREAAERNEPLIFG